MDAVLFKAAARGREVQEKREAERRRALLVLILRHLTDHGYIEAAERVSTESNVTLAKYDAADNISLLQILQDFEEAQEQRYGKRPKLVKQLTCEVCICFGVLQHAGHCNNLIIMGAKQLTCHVCTMSTACARVAGPSCVVHRSIFTRRQQKSCGGSQNAQ